MITVFIVLVVLLLPGTLLANCIQLSKAQITAGLSLSYAIFLTNVYLSAAIGSRYGILYIYGVELVILVFWYATIWLGRRTDISNTLYKTIHLWWPQTVVILITGLYILLVGPYLEIPADVWQHLGTIADYKRRFEFNLIDHNQPWYLLYAMALSFSGENIHQTIEPFTVASTILFMVMISEIARLIYLDAGFDPKRASVFCLLSVLLTLGAFGTNVFSYVRYYVFSPAYFSYPLFLFGVYLTTSLEWARVVQRKVVLTVGLVGMCLGILYFVHKQEAMFLIIYIGAYVCYRAGRHIWEKIDQGRKGHKGRQALRWLPLVVLGVCTLSAILWGIFQFTDGASLKGQTSLSNNTILVNPLEDIVWILADPSGRVYETLGMWGLVVLIIYFGFLRRGNRITALSVLSIVPFLLLFNPIFTYFFLPRAGQDVLWRLTYMIPIGLVGANVVVVAINNIQYRKIKNTIIISIILLALVPLTPLEMSQNSRWMTLKKISVSNSHRIWDDLMVELRRYPAKNILTDPVTGYVVRALTEHTVFGFKFHEVAPFIPINYAGYGPSSFRGYKSWLFIENKRDGSWSENGKKTGHWPADVMHVSSRYSKGLREFLKYPPPYIELLWENDGIRLFEITDKDKLCNSSGNSETDATTSKLEAYVNKYEDLLAAYKEDTSGVSKATWGKRHYCDEGRWEDRTRSGL